MDRLCFGCICLQGRPVPSHLVHWYIAQMQPPMADKLEEFLALCGSLRDQEEAVTQHAQQLLKVNEMLLEAVANNSCSDARAVIRHVCLQIWCVLSTLRNILHHCRCSRRCVVTCQQPQTLLHQPARLTMSWPSCFRDVQGNSTKLKCAR